MADDEWGRIERIGLALFDHPEGVLRADEFQQLMDEEVIDGSEEDRD